MFEKNFRLVGKGFKEKDIEDFFKEKREEGVIPIERELEKTAEEKRFIQKIDDYLGQEFQELGIKERFKIKQENFHFLSAEDFYQIFPDTEFDAFCLTPGNAVFINKDVYPEKETLFKVILHESIHLSAFKKFYIQNQKEGVNIYIVKPYRSGYKNINPSELFHIHFTGLNEAIVDKIVLDIFKKHKKDILKEFDIEVDRLAKENKDIFYNLPLEILEIVLEKIAKNNREKPEQVWQRFKKGFFTGEMMHLRDVEKTFGKGALRVLAFLGDPTKVLSEQEESKIKEYFLTDDKEKRDKIAKQVLSEREKLRYQKNK